MAKKKTTTKIVKKQKTDWQKAIDLAKKLDKELRSDDFRLMRAVKIVHGDGSVIFVDNAFVEKWNNYYIVLTEYHGYSVYDKEDLERISQYEEVGISRVAIAV